MGKDDDEPVRLPNVNAAILAKVNTVVYHRFSLCLFSFLFTGHLINYAMVRFCTIDLKSHPIAEFEENGIIHEKKC